MDVLQIVMPVLVMIILGMLCRKWKILTGEGVAQSIEPALVTNVMLPVAIFHALATAEYNKERNRNSHTDHVGHADCFLQPWICAEALSQGKISRRCLPFYGQCI